ncbi:(R)-mandelonitrile lyase [Hyalangium versicolor]|uniref:(R)-mandelonitrile lyase n=1 Tax=Hyalangium versicolor TaxID=2861190 RepID=UPI001CCE265A|nr:cupin domain-containing protein [Hyalangium versicolor]
MKWLLAPAITLTFLTPTPFNPSAQAETPMTQPSHNGSNTQSGGKSTAPASTSQNGSQHLVITRAGAQPSSQGPAANFTGSVVVTPLFAATEHTRASAASVAFQPCARSAWHTHPAGQTLVVTSGVGWIQEWGGSKREIRAGDVIWTPPGVKHWHGGTATSPMTHLAIQEHVNGKVVDWLEQVSEEQYRAPAE